MRPRSGRISGAPRREGRRVKVWPEPRMDTDDERSPTNPTRRAVRRGDVYWLDPGDADAPGVRVAHPHVVVQDDVFNLSRLTTVIVCALTSNLHRATEPGNVILEVGEGGLSRQSVVVVSQLASVERATLGAYIGTLSAARVEQILAGLRFQQASFGRA